MGRKSKYSAEEKLQIINEASQYGISKVLAKYNINEKTLRNWRYLYQYQGLQGLKATHCNQRYSKEFKQALVEEFQQSNESNNLKAYMPRKRDSKMRGQETNFEERLMIIEELIKHNIDYNWAVEKYQISYQQIYSWYQKYRKSGNDPESLRDRRGRVKPENGMD